VGVRCQGEWVLVFQILEKVCGQVGGDEEGRVPGNGERVVMLVPGEEHRKMRWKVVKAEYEEIGNGEGGGREKGWIQIGI